MAHKEKTLRKFDNNRRRHDFPPTPEGMGILPTIL